MSGEHAPAAEHVTTAQNESTQGVYSDGSMNENIVGGGSHVVSDVVFVIFLMLLIGITTRHIFSRIPIPYTVLLLIWGLAAGALSWYATEHHGGWHAVNVGLTSLAAIDPNGMLLIFMPILIYGSAQAMDWHTLQKEFLQILLMASTGVIMSMCFTAIFIFYVFPFGWSWHECFMFGALISATDPVAVVALLHEVGASVRLGTIIEGESLLNDGTAFVLFLIFKEYVLFNTCCDEPNEVPDNVPTAGCKQYVHTQVCEPFSAGDATLLFLKLSFGGPASGIMFGLLMVVWLTYTFNDEIVEIFITITGAYITFYISEDIFGVSGVLSIVSLGFFMAAFGKSKISPRVLHPMETAWELLEWGANTVIFILAGLIMTENLAPIIARGSSEADLEIGSWIGWGIVLYLACVVIRFITIFIHFPLLRNIGYGMSWQQAIIISWSGLRGAIGLALALLVNLDTALRPAFRQQVLVFTSIVVILTLLINGSLTKKLLEVLGILRPEPIKLEFLCQTIQEMEEFADNHCSHLKADNLIGQPDWEKVVALSHIDAEQLIDKKWLKQLDHNPSPLAETAAVNAAMKAVDKDVEAAESMLDRSEKQVASTSGRLAAMNAKNVKQAELLKDVRSRLLHGLKATYNEGFHKGYIGSDEVLELVGSVDKSLDNLDNAIRDWELVEPHARIGKMVVTMQSRDPSCHYLGPLTGLPQRLLFLQLEHGLILAAAFVYAHKHTRQRLKESLKDIKESLEERENDGSDHETIVHTNEAVDITLSESRASSDKATKFIKALRYAYPEVTRAVKTKLAAMTVLRKKGQFLDHLLEGGLLEHKDYEAIQKAIIRRTNLLSIGADLGTGKLPEAKEFLRSSPLFQQMSDEDFEAEVMPIARHVLFQSGDTLFTKGDNPTSFFIVIRGTTSISDNSDLNIGEMDHQGSAVGVSEVLLGWPRRRTVKAVSIVEGFEIKSEKFAELIVRQPEIEKMAWKHAGGTVAMMNKEQALEHVSCEDALEWFLGSQVLIHLAGEDVHIIGHNYLVHGSMSSVLGQRAINKTTSRTDAPTMLGPSFQHLQVTSDFAVLLQLPDRAVTAKAIGGDAAAQVTRSSLSMSTNSKDISGTKSLSFAEKPGTLKRGLSHKSASMAGFSSTAGGGAPLSRMSAAYIQQATNGVSGRSQQLLAHRSAEARVLPSPRTVQTDEEARQQRGMEMVRRLSMGPGHRSSGTGGPLLEGTILEQDSRDDPPIVE